jgi:Uma2 family endonuclease
MLEVQTTATPPPIFFSPLLHRYTLEEFWSLPEPKDRSRYELVGGMLFVSPPPNPPHGDIGAYMTDALTEYLRKHDKPGRVYHPQEAIYTDKDADIYLEPDMMYVSDRLRKKMGRLKRTSADIVFEYLSESTAVYDRTTKADTYLVLGVKELWLVDPVKETIEVRNARKKKGQLFWDTRVFQKGQRAESKVLTGWRVSVSDLFASLS